MKRKIPEMIKYLLPLVVVGVLLLCCASAPAMAEIPEKQEMPDTGELSALLEQLDARLEELKAASEQEKTEQEPEDKEQAQPIVEEPKAELLSAAKGNYEDGVYTGTGTGYGGSIQVQVAVEDGSMTDITVLSAPGETASFFSRATAVIDSILAAQTWEVDAIAGATYSSNGIKAAVKNAMTGEVTVSSTGNRGTTGNAGALTEVVYEEPEGYVDGVYTGTAQGFGGPITVEVTIAAGEITVIDVVSAEGETPSYLSRAMVVTDRIIAAQSPNVDTVAGATYSSNGIINAVKNALAKAERNGTGETEPEETTPPETGEENPDNPDNPEKPENPENTENPENPENPEKPENTEKPEGNNDPETPADPENPEQQPDGPNSDPEAQPDPDAPGEQGTPSTTTETRSETYTGYSTVLPDEDEDFAAYNITVTVSVSVTVKTTILDNVKTIETTRRVTGVTVSGATGANARFSGNALSGMQSSLINNGTADAVAGATCSSRAIYAGYTAALSGVTLGTVTETVEVEG